MTAAEMQPASTNPHGVTFPQPADLPSALAPQWRPEDDVTDSLYALAERIDGTDELFDSIAHIAATRLLMAGAELDVIAARREMGGAR